MQMVNEKLRDLKYEKNVMISHGINDASDTVKAVLATLQDDSAAAGIKDRSAWLLEPWFFSVTSAC